MLNLPILQNDTDNVIEFNSSFLEDQSIIAFSSLHWHALQIPSELNSILGLVDMFRHVSESFPTPREFL